MDVNKIKEFSPVMGSDEDNKTLRSQIEEKTEVIANENFEIYERQSEEQNEKNCDLYQKREIKEVQELIGREIEDDLHEGDFDLMGENSKEDLNNSEINTKIDGRNIIEEKPKSSKSFWGKMATPFNNAALSVYKISKNIFYPGTKSSLLDQSALVKQAYDIVLKLLPVQESKQWESVLKAIPEKELKEFIQELVKLPKMYANTLNELLKEHKGLGIEIVHKDLHEVLGKLVVLASQLQDNEKLDQTNSRKLIRLIMELKVPIENTNFQLISDNVERSVYFIDNGPTMSRVSHNIESFKNEHQDTSDVSLKYLSENGFKDVFPHFCSSTVWEMELGEDKGECRLFQKGYGKILIALPGVDIREIRIPLDLRFFAMDKIAQEKVIFSILNDIIASDDIQKYLSAKSLVGELNKKYSTAFIEKRIDQFIDKGLKGEIKGISQYLIGQESQKLSKILLEGQWPGKWDQETQKIIDKYPKLITNSRVYKYLANCNEEVRQGFFNLKLEDFEKIKRFPAEWLNKAVIHEKEFSPVMGTDEENMNLGKALDQQQKEDLEAYKLYCKDIKNFKMVFPAIKQDYNNLSPQELLALFKECQLLLQHPEDVETVVCIQDLNGCTELKKEENLKMVRGLLEELNEEKKLFLEKLKGTQGDYKEIINMFKFVRAYGGEMLQKSFSSLGRDYLHFDGVVSHFETFPKEMIKQLSSDIAFREEYVYFSSILYAMRRENIKIHLFHEEDKGAVQNLLSTSEDAFKRINEAVDKSSLSKQEKITVKKYLKYMRDLSVNSWKDSKLTQITFIGDVLEQLKILPQEILTEDTRIDVAIWLSDPTACRLIHEVIQYSQIVKKENLDTLERGGKIAIDSHHNQRLHGLAIDLIRNLKEFRDPIDKQALVGVVKELLRSSMDPESSGVNFEVNDLLADIEELGELLEIWDKESVDISKIDNTKLLSQIDSGKNINISDLHKESQKRIDEYKEKLMEMHKECLPKNLSDKEKIDINLKQAELLNSAQTLEELEDAVNDFMIVIENLIKENKLVSKLDRKEFSDLMSAIRTSERFKELIKEKVLALVPKNLPEKVKNEFLGNFQEAFSYLSPFQDGEVISNEEMKKFLDFLDNLKIKRQDEILYLYHPTKKITGEKVFTDMPKCCSIEAVVRFTEPMLPLFEQMTPLSLQIVHDTVAMSSYHPSYLVIRGLEVREGGDLRSLGRWNTSNRNELIYPKIRTDSSEVLVEENYLLRKRSPHLMQRSLWHMEEGDICPLEKEDIKGESINKKARVLKSGYGRVSVSVPTTGTIRSLRFSVDLSPFHLKTAEDVREILVMIGKAGQKEDVRKALVEAIKDLKMIGGDRFVGIIDQPELFIETAIKYLRKMEKALAKTLVAVNNPNIHFSDVDEEDAYIPQQMLERTFLKEEKHRKLWNNYLQAVAKLRDNQMDIYFGEKIIVDVDEIDELNKVGTLLLEAIDEVFTNKEDLEVIKKYIGKIKALALDPWDKQDYALKLIEKNIFIAAKLQQNQDLLGLRKLLFPFLIDGNCLKAFNDWLRALQVARKANASIEEPTGEEFHNQRLEKKKNKLLEMLENRPEMTQQQMKDIAKWVNNL